MVTKSYRKISEDLVHKLESASSERSHRRAIVSCVNFASELLSASKEKVEMEYLRLIVRSLLNICENRKENVARRESALNGLSRILERVTGLGLNSRLPDQFDRLQGLTRRRSDEIEFLKSCRSVHESLLVKPGLSDLETQSDLDTIGDQSPHFQLLNEKRNELERLRGKIVESVNAILHSAAGYKPATFEEGVEIASSINELAQRHGLELSSPEVEGSILLSFRKIGGAKSGAFVFRGDGTTKYLGVEVPLLISLD